MFYFCHFTYILNPYFELLKNSIGKTTYITTFTIGVMEDNNLGYDHFGGFSIKFEKDGGFDIFLCKDFSNHDISSLKTG